MSEPTGFHDAEGIPIHVGDLIRVKHFKHVRNRRQMWIYFRVAIGPTSTKPEDYGRFVVQNWSDLDSTKWQCLLRDCGVESAEVLAHEGLEYNERGHLICFNERPRVRHP